MTKLDQLIARVPPLVSSTPAVPAKNELLQLADWSSKKLRPMVEPGDVELVDFSVRKRRMPHRGLSFTQWSRIEPLQPTVRLTDLPAEHEKGICSPLIKNEWRGVEDGWHLPNEVEKLGEKCRTYSIEFQSAACRAIFEGYFKSGRAHQGPQGFHPSP